MRHILAATDLSSPSDLALDRAIGLAAHTGAALTILSVEESHDASVLSMDANPLALGEFTQRMAEFTASQLIERVERAAAIGVTATPVHKRGRPTDVICDPASGTCGFLVAAGEYIREHHKTALTDPKQRDHFHASGKRIRYGWQR